MANDLKSLRARNGEGGPQIQGLRETKDIRSTVSSQGLYMYDEKRPDFIQYMGGGQNWERLSSALRGLNPQLNAYLFKQGEDLRQRNTALGQELMHRNKTDWATFIKTHPEYAGLNPHLERGYKSAELMTKAQDYQAAQQDFYTTSGLVNETDTEKVRAALSEFGQKWIQENVSPEALGYAYDPELYAENFLRPAQAAEGAIMNRHSGDRANENLKLAADKYGRFMTSSIENLFKNTPNVSDPAVFEKATDELGNRITNFQNEMLAAGMPLSMAVDLTEDAIINLARSEGEEGFGDELLAGAGKIKTGSGPLSGRPTFRAKEKALKESWKNERYIDGQRAEQNLNKKRRELTIQAYSIMDAEYTETGRILDVKELKERLGTDLTRIGADIAYDAVLNFTKGTEVTPRMDEAGLLEYTDYELRARTVGIPDEERGRIRAKFGMARGDKILALSDERLTDDPVSKMLRSSDVQNGLSTLDDALIAAYGSTAENKDKVMYKRIEAKRMYLDGLETAIQEGKIKTPAQLRIYEQQLQNNIITNPFFQTVESAGGSPIMASEFKAMHTKDFWKENKTQFLGTKENAEKIFEAYVKSPDALPAVLNEYNIPQEYINVALGNQAMLYGVDLMARQQDYIRKNVLEQSKGAEELTRKLINLINWRRSVADAYTHPKF